MKDFVLFCGGCGREMSYQKAWRAGLVKTLVCSAECKAKVEMDYCGMIVESAHG